MSGLFRTLVWVAAACLIAWWFTHSSGCKSASWISHSRELPSGTLQLNAGKGRCD